MEQRVAGEDLCAALSNMPKRTRFVHCSVHIVVVDEMLHKVTRDIERVESEAVRLSAVEVEW